jgi:hypothetical protein
MIDHISSSIDSESEDRKCNVYSSSLSHSSSLTKRESKSSLRLCSDNTCSGRDVRLLKISNEISVIVGTLPELIIDKGREKAAQKESKTKRLRRKEVSVSEGKSNTKRGIY